MQCTAAALYCAKIILLQIKENFYGIPAPLIVAYIQQCSVCAMRQTLSTRAPLTPIVCTRFWARVQIDLIDTRKYEYEGYKWILTTKDHMFRFVILDALKSKTALEVVQ